MKTILRCAVVAAAFVIVGCESDAKKHAPVPIVLQGDKGDPVTLQIPRGYIEQPEKPEGKLPNVILRIDAGDFTASTAFVPKSEVRMLIEPASGAMDAGHERHAAALRKAKSSEDALVKVDSKSKPDLIAYSYPNGSEDAEAYYLTSKTGDVFLDCRRGVCSAFKTWKKRVHLRVDSQPASTADVHALDASIDQMLQSFAGEGAASTH